MTVRECAQSIPRLEKPKNRRFSHKNPKMFDFRFNTPIPSLNQGQGSIFTLRECVESISRIKLPLGTYFYKNFQKIFFRDPAMIVTPSLTREYLFKFSVYSVIFSYSEQHSKKIFEKSR